MPACDPFACHLVHSSLNIEGSLLTFFSEATLGPLKLLLRDQDSKLLNFT